MNEIPALLSIAEDRDRLPPEEIAEEDTEYALIWIIERLARAVHVVHSQGRHMKRKAQVHPASRGLCVSLRRILGYAVVGRGRAWMVFRYGKSGGMPVVRHGARVDQPGHLVLYAELNDIDGSLGVSAKIRYRI